jgi:type I restriction enzyme R subunit
VLFLADRTALVRQAKNAYNKHLPQASLVNLAEEKEDDTSRVVFSTYPTIMNSIDDARRDGQKRFGNGHFDLIIIDAAAGKMCIRTSQMYWERRVRFTT